MNIFAKLSILVAVVLSAPVAVAQLADGSEESLDPKMSQFKEACLTERKAAAEKSQLAMMKAHKLFKGIKTEPFKYEVVSETPKESLGKAVMEFTPEYCEYLIKNQYSIVPMDSLDAMRETPDACDVMTDSFSLQPNSGVAISIRARGKCAMLVISEDGMPLTVSSSIDGNPLMFNTENDGTVNWKTWELPRTFRNMEFKIENPNDRTVSFVIAVQ